VDSDTSAYIGDADINLDTSGVNSAQSVNVAAANRTQLFGLQTGITAANLAGLAGGRGPWTRAQ